MVDKFRGYPIKSTKDGYVFCDTGELTVETWKSRPCGHCGLYNTPEGHDGCLKTLPNVRNACCGHGVVSEAYVQLLDWSYLQGQEALDFFKHNISKI